MTKNEKIKLIALEVRTDLKECTEIALKLCTTEEIDNILNKSDITKCIEIEYTFIKMVLQDRIEESLIEVWDIRDGALYDVVREKYLPDIRNNKINKLID